MFVLPRAFNQLCLISKHTVSAILCRSVQIPDLSASHSACRRIAVPVVDHMARYMTSKPKPSSVKNKKDEETVNYEPASPYRVPGPRYYGYETKYFTGGLLPRGEHLPPITNLPRYEISDAWSKKKALFGQNDYIDILGDGSVSPAETLKGPRWLLGFKGNELQRLTRRLKFQADKLKYLYPTQYRNIQKRIFYLYKKYNRKRGKRIR